MTDSTLKLPEEFSLRMKHHLGMAFPDFEKSLRSASPVSIRLNPKKEYTIEGESVPWSKSGKYLEKRPVFTLDPAFHAGAYYVQEASSMFLEQVFFQLGLTLKPLRILDLCAAPGGKSTHILSLVHPDSLVVSNEVIRSRAAVLAENITKWGYDNCIVTNNDPEDFQRLPGFFDVIVVDAPCTGEGLFRKDPHAMKEWSVEHADHCAKRQRRILADIWPSLKTNGLLVYCTCTYNPLENEEHMVWFNTQHQIESPGLNLDKNWGVEKVEQGNVKAYRLYPHRVKGEGFFLTMVRKNEIQKEILIKLRKTTGNLPQKITDQVSTWLKHSEEFYFQSENETVYTIRETLRETSSFLQQHLKIISAGTSIAVMKGNKLIPEHALAVSVNLNKENFPGVELSLEEALSFLRKDNLTLPEYKKGHALVTYTSLPLGWLNVLENRVNNLYPKEWRIRMKVN